MVAISKSSSLSPRTHNNASRKRRVSSILLLVACSCHAFTPSLPHQSLKYTQSSASILQLHRPQQQQQNEPPTNHWASLAAAGFLSLSLLLGSPQGSLAENELSAKYGSGLDTSLVDQTCLVNQCSAQTTACLIDDADCRKGLTCTAKCLGDNACITGCMARYGNQNLDNLLKCTIEDHECIKVAILPGGGDAYGNEPPAPAPTVLNFDPRTLEGSWYKVIGYNPNYDCYACQRNSFHRPSNDNDVWFQRPSSVVSQLHMDVEFSMPHLLPDGAPPPPTNTRESVVFKGVSTSQSIGLNAYNTHETMVFDVPSSAQRYVVNAGTDQEQSYARTAHSEGEMFGLKFWENWYVIGENELGQDEEFKFIYYNGKTRQNTYEGAFIYSRTPELSEESMKKVYEIAKNAGMNPDQFCRIQNRGCFAEKEPVQQPPANSFRGILASTKISQLLGVEPVAARDTVRPSDQTAKVLNPSKPKVDRPWWYEVGDYLENPHRHFAVMDELRQPMVWPDVKK
ncbi:hypothetical protein FisN_22Lh163 [Fistulifera solaris]|uniref:VDE lipocalin domain-containing protein n=1 Tax=Fistulifera solaris TaxID=1519565 RepID=A0A1Z5JCH7_FISSO|nr:hypothetical protein FisN_22Lh163 [Fistulifera solaris]|eukprot:GAX11478.1 hypothetical protein FisN_22Lh163 [Fistulifera solaris]